MAAATRPRPSRPSRAAADRPSGASSLLVLRGLLCWAVTIEVGERGGSEGGR